MPTLVQNLENGPTVFSDVPNNISLEWAGAGDKGGGDVQYVPDALMDNVAFMKAINRGIFKVVEADEEVQAKLDQQKELYANQKSGISYIDRDAEKPIADVSVATEGREVGQVQANDPEEEGQVKTQTHTPGTVVTETEERDSDGRPVSEEMKVTIGPREKG